MVEALEKDGWHQFKSDAPILEIARSLGEPVPSRDREGFISLLKVQTANEGHPNSLTSRYGTGRFDYHTDGAHFPKVPRYLVMRLATGAMSKRPTELIDLIDVLSIEERKVLQTERWKYSYGYKCFLSTIISNEGLRYDPNIMRPAVKSRNNALKIISHYTRTIKPIKVDWIEGRIVVVDNHRIIHARASASGETENRILERVMVL